MQSSNILVQFLSQDVYIWVFWLNRYLLKNQLRFLCNVTCQCKKRRQYFARAVSRWYIYLSKALNLFTKFSVNFLLCDTSIRHLRCPLSMKNFFDALIQISAKRDGKHPKSIQDLD